MNKFLQKSLFVFLSLCFVSTQGADQAPQESTITESSMLLQDKAMLELLREEFEEHITQVRTQTDQIGYALQQLTQTLQANKTGVSNDQKDLIITQLIEIKNFTDLLLEKFFTQTSPEVIQLGLILNNVLAKYLLKTIKVDLLSINATKLNIIIDRHLQQEHNPVHPETIQHMMVQNEKLITELIGQIDVIGLTWYNKTYRFLKKHNAYGIARGTSVALVSTVAAACIYNTYFRNPDSFIDSTDNGWMQIALNKLGRPLKFGMVQIPDANGKLQELPGKIAGNGILGNCSEILKTTMGYGIISFAPFVTLDLKSILSGMYYQYWATTKATALNRWNKFEAFCAGCEKKQDLGDCEKVYFKDMTGAQDLEDLAKRITNYLVHPERYERTQMEEHRCILLWGPPQTGKTLFVKALKTMIDEQQKIKFFDAKAFLDYYPDATIDEIFRLAKQIAPCILFIDEIDLVGAHREKNARNTGQLLTNMQGIDMASNKVFIIGATNKLEQLDKALIVDGRFGKLIHIDYPKYQQRKSYLEQQLAKRSIQLDPIFVDYMAQETEGASYNILKRLITESLIISTIALRPVTQADFEKTLDTEIRKIAKSFTHVSPEEKKVIATHQAGKALMHHLLQTKKEVVKITILPVSKSVKTNEYGWAIKTDQSKGADNDTFAEQPKEQKSKNGEVFTKTSTTDATLVCDEENKKEALCLLAGNVAQKVILNKSFTKCNPQDRADAMQLIYTDLLQGEAIDKTTRAKALETKELYERTIEQLLIRHKDILEKIINILVEHNSIDRYQWAEIIKDCPTA